MEQEELARTRVNQSSEKIKQRPNFDENLKLNASFEKNDVLICACLFWHNRLSNCVNFRLLEAELSSPWNCYPLLSPFSAYPAYHYHCF